RERERDSLEWAYARRSRPVQIQNAGTRMTEASPPLTRMRPSYAATVAKKRTIRSSPPTTASHPRFRGHEALPATISSPRVNAQMRYAWKPARRENALSIGIRRRCYGEWRCGWHGRAGCARAAGSRGPTARSERSERCERWGGCGKGTAPSPGQDPQRYLPLT